MANQFYVAPANPLEALIAGQRGYQFGNELTKQAASRAAGQALANGDTRGALAVLMERGGSLNEALPLMGLMNNERDYQFRVDESRRAQANADRSHGFQVSQANRPPEGVRTLQAAGVHPASPEGRKALFPRTDTPISATDKKAIFEAEDEIPGVKGTIENLQRALELNGQTFSGMGAGMRATIGANLPDKLVPDFLADKKTAVTTQEWQKIMGPEALQQMANTLKGATTDFELRKFIEMLGDPATDPKVREGVIKRMQILAQRKLELSESRARELRGGTYFKPGGGQGGGPVKVNSPAERDALPPGTSYIAPDGSLRTKQ